MKKLVIIGSGGMGRVFYDLARESAGYNKTFLIKGFLDDDLKALDCFGNFPPVIGQITDYTPEGDEVFICSIGSSIRKKCMEAIINKGGEFINLIHKTARLGTNIKLGKGNFIGAYTTIAANASIGNYNFIQSYSIIGHDVEIGNWNRIDSHVVCIGGIKIENEVMIHTSAVLNHDVIVESNSHIGACSFVTLKVEQGTTVYGNPARRLK